MRISSGKHDNGWAYGLNVNRRTSHHYEEKTEKAAVILQVGRWYFIIEAGPGDYTEWDDEI